MPAEACMHCPATDANALVTFATNQKLAGAGSSSIGKRFWQPFCSRGVRLRPSRLDRGSQTNCKASYWQGRPSFSSILRCEDPELSQNSTPLQLSTLDLRPPSFTRARRSPICSSFADEESPNSSALTDEESFDSSDLTDEGSSQSSARDNVFEEVAVAIEKVGRNTRRIEASVDICVPTNVVWGVLTDYASLADIIPGLVVNEVLERRERGAKLLQVGEQDVAFGAKFSAQIVMDVEEVPEDTLVDGRKEIEFRQLEGDFQKFEGVWRMEQIASPPESQSSGQDSDGEVESTRLSYIVEVSPQRWMPVRLIEGRISKEIGNNLRSIKEEALKRC